MEGHFDWLVLLIVAGISVVSFLVKRKERSRDESSKPQTTFNWDESDESEEYGERYRNHEDQAYKSTPEVRGRVVTPADRSIQMPPPVFRSVSGNTGGVATEQGYAWGAPKNSSNDPVHADQDAEIPDVSSIIDDFDLPSAVIYSEILHPKYK